MITPTHTNHHEPVALTVLIDARRAQMLWHTAAPAKSFLDAEGRFESHDGAGTIDDQDIDAWTGGTFMWCAGPLEAMTLNDYESSCGYSSRLLWDMDSGPNWPGGYVVLTSRPFGRSADTSTQ
ncbi:hypothetical protein [Angustibacter sp. Root456]|uniref:hypothetical protein n=1 Tax=Angustibacter sp. Root456 TaxID=1736539 RepID=UPI0012FB42B7|nr:hypothetical protein [Angustibacter sp. Root456]